MTKQFSRRDFLAKGAASLGTLASLSAFARTVAAQPGGQRRVIHVMGYSHIDAAWLWPWRDGSDEVLNTFRSALDRIKETPGFRYSHSSSAHYRWVERANPQMFQEILQRIKENRWEVVGGWPVEPDCNIPATESFVRHSLYGKRYCRRALGVDVKIGFNPDSFGHAAGLPTILKNAGYGYYVFMRPGEHEMTLPQLFWWEGPDGSRILTLRVWDYGASPDRIPKAAVKNFAPGFDHAAFVMGVGDHGGAVTKKQIAGLLELKKDTGLPELRWSTFREFFSAIENSPALSSLPVVRSELQHHARGCYAAYGEGKSLNRRAERSLVQAETLSQMTELSAGLSYPSADYDEAWWKVAFNQFHDMMAGTSQYTDYQDVRDSVGWACETANASKVQALELLAGRVDMSEAEEGCVFLFNPLPWKRKALVEYVTDDSPNGKRITHLRAKDGTKIPLQWRPAGYMSDSKDMLSAWVDLPACGYKVFELGHGEPPSGQEYSERFEFSEIGYGVSSIKAEDGQEILRASVGLVVISDTSDTWGHDIDQFRHEIGRPELVSSTLMEEGPVTRVTRYRARWQSSEIVLDVAEFAGLDVVELSFVIDWHEHEQILKLEIPTALENPKVFAKVPGAAIERKTNGQEEPYQDWLAVEGSLEGNTYTLALANNSTYSYDCLSGLLRTTVIRSAPFARHYVPIPNNDDHAWQDQGRQERRFWLMAAKGSHTSLGLDRRADELQTPAEYVMNSRHAGSEPWERSFLEVIPSTVAVLAVKRAEGESGATIVRLQERSGKQTEAVIQSDLWQFHRSVQLQPWELKTLRIELGKEKSGNMDEVSLLET